MSTRPPSLGPSPRKPPRGRRTPAGPSRGLLAAVVAGALVVAALAVALSGGGEPSPQASTTAPPPAVTAPATPTDADPGIEVPPAPEEPQVSVPDTPGPAPEPPTADEPPDAPRLPGPRDVPAVTPLPVKPSLDAVRWPDEKWVAAVALATGTEIARLDGRAKFRTAAVRRMKKTVAPNVLLRLQQVYATNPPAPKDPRVQGAITALSLQEEPQTGARIAVMAYWRLEGGRRHTGVMRLEFAPAQAVVTDYLVT